MNIEVVGGSLIVGALPAIAPPSNRSLAVTKDTAVSSPPSGHSQHP